MFAHYTLTGVTGNIKAFEKCDFWIVKMKVAFVLN